MGGDESQKRLVRSFRTGTGEHKATEAWRSPSGHTLVFFSPDRARAALPPELDLADLTEVELTELLAGAVSLTVTETVFEATDGRLWLAQRSGPVWAEGSGASGAFGVVFTSLTGSAERRRIDLDEPLPGDEAEASCLPPLLEAARRS